jgi:hypothetical protein
LLALAILGTSLAAIGGFIRMGSQGAVNAREMTSAQLLCEAKLAEITAGILPAEVGGPWPFDLAEQAGWVYYVDIQTLPQPGLVSLTVTVGQELPVGSTQRPLSFALTRWIQDPGLELPESATEEEAASGTTSSSTTTPAASSSSAGGASGR